MQENTLEHKFEGIHVFGEMYGIEGHLIDNVTLLEEALKQGIEASGATLCHMQVKKFEPQGVTILALLSESHASIHTYPDYGAIFFDAFTCGVVCQPQRIGEVLESVLKPTKSHLQTIRRGEDVLNNAPSLPPKTSSTFFESATPH